MALQCLGKHAEALAAFSAGLAQVGLYYIMVGFYYIIMPGPEVSTAPRWPRGGCNEVSTERLTLFFIFICLLYLYLTPSIFPRNKYLFELDNVFLYSNFLIF